MKGQRLRSALMVGAAALAIASCSSDGSSSPNTEPPVTRASTTTTIETATTTAVEETNPPNTEVTSPSTASPTTTTTTATTSEAPTPSSTTSVPPESVPVDPLSEDAAAAEVQRLFDLWTECLAAMPDCVPAVVSSNYVGDYRDFLFLQASSWSEEGFTIENTESRQVVIESVSVEEGVATVIACEDNGTVLINGDGVVVDDVYESARVEWTLASDGSGWLGSDLVDLEVAEGEENVLCDE